MSNGYPRRKSPRINGYDYSNCGAYFITICTYERRIMFSLGNQRDIAHASSVGADSISARAEQAARLNEHYRQTAARLIDRSWNEAIAKYPGIASPCHVVMPNHFHAVVTLERADMESAPTLFELVQTFKRLSTIEYIKLVKNGVLPRFHKKIWQRSFHDHIIKDDAEYSLICEYILSNPRKWEMDRFHPTNFPQNLDAQTKK